MSIHYLKPLKYQSIDSLILSGIPILITFSILEHKVLVSVSIGVELKLCNNKNWSKSLLVVLSSGSNHVYSTKPLDQTSLKYPANRDNPAIQGHKKACTVFSVICLTVPAGSTHPEVTLNDLWIVGDVTFSKSNTQHYLC